MPHPPDEVTLIKFCDLMLETPTYEQCAKRLQVSVRTLFRWLRASQITPEDYTFEWSECTAPLHVHCRSAARMHAHIVEATARKLAHEGHEEIVTYQGRICYVEDEEKAKYPNDPDMWEMIDGARDIYKRDEDGHRVPLTIKHKPSDQLISLVLRGHFPTTYGTQNVNVDVTHSGGVKVIGVPAGAKPKQEPRIQAPAADRLAEIRARRNGQTVDAEFTETPAEPAATAEPVKDASAPRPGDSPVVAELRARLRELQERGPTNPHPKGPVQKFDGTDVEINDAKRPKPASQPSGRPPSPPPDVLTRPAYARPSGHRDQST